MSLLGWIWIFNVKQSNKDKREPDIWSNKTKKSKIRGEEKRRGGGGGDREGEVKKKWKSCRKERIKAWEFQISGKGVEIFIFNFFLCCPT